MIIHISGTPGSGKTTLGLTLAKLYPEIIVFDTDEFIQPDNNAGKYLTSIHTKVSTQEYQKEWNRILTEEISKFTSKHSNKIIIFTGILNNFSDDGTIYELTADYKFYIDIPLWEVLKRYYTRICKDESTRSISESKNYWNLFSHEKFSISSSGDIIKNYNDDLKWHVDHGYLVLNDKRILSRVKDIVKKTSEHKYKKYKKKYQKLKRLKGDNEIPALEFNDWIALASKKGFLLKWETVTKMKDGEKLELAILDDDYTGDKEIVTPEEFFKKVIYIYPNSFDGIIYDDPYSSIKIRPFYPDGGYESVGYVGAEALVSDRISMEWSKLKEMPNIIADLD